MISGDHLMKEVLARNYEGGLQRADDRWWSNETSTSAAVYGRRSTSFSMQVRVIQFIFSPTLKSLPS